MEENRVGQISLERYRLEYVQHEEQITKSVWQKAFYQCAPFSVPERICQWYVSALELEEQIFYNVLKWNI